MNKKLLSCLWAFVLICVFAFSAGAVCARPFAADVVMPFDGEMLGDDEPETAIPEGETFVLYGSEEIPSEQTLPTDDGGEQANPSVIKPVLICAGLGLVIGLIVVLAVKSGYKPVRRRSDAAEYLVDGSLHVTVSEETFVRSETTERTIEKKNPSE